MKTHNNTDFQTTEGMDPRPQKEDIMDQLIVVFNFYVPLVVYTLGFIGNTLTFIMMTKSIREKRNVLMSFHFRALALGDNVFILLVMYQRMTLSRFPDAFDLHGNFLCKEFFFVLFTFFGISVWNVVIISIDRFVAVCFPLKAAAWCTVKRATACYAFNVLFHILFNMVKLWKEYRSDGTDVHTATCVNPRDFPPWFEKFIVMFFESLVNYASPLSVLILNIFILVRFKRQGKELQGMEEQRRAKKLENQERSLTVMMMTVAFTFIFLMAYYPVENITWDFIIPDIGRKYPKIRELSFYIAFYFTAVNMCINFYLYCLVSPPFRADVVRLFSRRKK